MLKIVSFFLFVKKIFSLGIEFWFTVWWFLWINTFFFNFFSFISSDKCICNEFKVTQSCPTFCYPMDYTVHEILDWIQGIQARILEWVGIPFSRGSLWPKNRIGVFCIAGRFFTSWTTKMKLIKACLCYGIIKHSIGVFCPWCYNTCGVLLRKRNNKHEKKKSKGYKDRQWYCCCCLVSCNPMDCSPPGSSVCVMSQTRIQSGLSFPSTGNPPNLCFLYHLHWRCRFFPISHQRSPRVREY